MMVEVEVVAEEEVVKTCLPVEVHPTELLTSKNTWHRGHLVAPIIVKTTTLPTISGTKKSRTGCVRTG